MSGSEAVEGRLPAGSPVRAIRGEADRPPEDGIALCLSGGGYRAMLFHAGALWRLNEVGLLSELDRVSSVSGGSITSGVLGCNWGRLDFDGDGVARGFQQALIDPVRRLAGKTIDLRAILMGAFLPGMIADRLAGSYDRHLFGGATLQALPDRPRFVLNATNLQSGALWRFSKPYMADYRVGTVENPTVKLSVAVAASSAFPPILSPLRPKVDLGAYAADGTKLLADPTFRRRPTLTDGGVYDNLGLETAWKRYRTILVSDGGGQYAPQARVRAFWPLQTVRVIGTIDSQVRSLRKQQVVDSFTHGVRKGAYWSIWSEVDDFGLPDSLEVPDDRAKKLAREATRLKRLDPALQERLANWGYAICDTAIRKFVRPGAPRPARLPYPEAGI